MLDNDLLDAKLESLRRCLNRITEKTPPAAQELVHDHDAQDILAVNLQRAIQICVDLGSYLISNRGWPAPTTMAQTFSVLANQSLLSQDIATSLSKAVGFRNISVHEYQEVDWIRVHQQVTENLDVFRLFAQTITTAWTDTN